MLFKNRTYKLASNSEPTWCFWRWRDILDPKTKNLYLRRLYILQTPFFGVKLHWIKMIDHDRHLHNHPWNFISFVIKGGYYEEIFDRLSLSGKSLNFIRFFNFKRDVDFHRISHIQPGTITLVFNGPKIQSWGFQTENGFVSWREYLNESRT